MKKVIGFLVAVEINAIFKLYSNYEELDCPKGYKLYKVEDDKKIIYVIKTGLGEISAAGGIQYLITKYNVSMIVNFGVVGGLTLDMKKHKICLVDKVVYYKMDCSEFMDLKVGQVDGHPDIYLYPDKTLLNKALSLSTDLICSTCCSGDKFVSTEVEKKYLHDTFTGDICDMESAAIVLTCEANSVPCILFKAVSDGLSDGAKSFYDELEEASYNCLKVADEVINSIIK